MEGKREDRRIRRTKRLLIQALTKLMQQKQVNEITVKELTDLADINRGTFYLHFRDIYDLLERIEDELLDGMAECVESCMKRLRKDSGKLSCIAACKDVVLYYERNKSYISVLLGEGGDAAFVHRLKDRLKPLWRTYVVGAAAGRPEEEIDYLLEYTLAGSLFMISRWLSDPGTLSAWQLAHLVYDYSIKDVRERFGA